MDPQGRSAVVTGGAGGLGAAAIAANPYLNGETVRLDGALRFPPK